MASRCAAASLYCLYFSMAASTASGVSPKGAVASRLQLGLKHESRGAGHVAHGQGAAGLEQRVRTTAATAPPGICRDADSIEGGCGPKTGRP